MDLSSLNKSMNIVINKIETYLDNTPDIDFATFEQQQDIPYVSNKYNEMVMEYSKLLNLITEIQYFVSQCKKVMKVLGDSTALESNQKAKIKSAIDIVEEVAKPLYNEEKRLKCCEMFWRSIYTRKDF